ncbi:MAG: H-NS histone family protein [Azonexus sp.]
MSLEIKYRHPFNHDLTWSGRGKAPKWYDHALENGLTEEALRVESQAVVVSGDSDIDLGIGDVTTPTVVIAAESTGSALVRLDDLAVHVGVLTKNTDELLVIAADSLNMAALAFVRAGVAFLQIQENFSQSERSDSGNSERFVDWIEQQGIPKQRFYEAISAAKFVMRLPAAEVGKAVAMGKSRLMLLASLPQEVIDQAAESGNDLVDKADMMTVRELKEEIRRLERAAKNMDAEIERKDSQVKRLSEAKKRTTDFLLRTEELREECMALQLGAELPLNSLRRLFDDTEISGSEGFLQAETIWIAVNAIASRALDLIQHIRDCGPESLPDRPQAKHLLGPEEAARWLADYPLIENRFEGEKALRESRREAARPRGPGRPKGSGSKAGEE